MFSRNIQLLRCIVTRWKMCYTSNTETLRCILHTEKKELHFTHWNIQMYFTHWKTQIHLTNWEMELYVTHWNIEIHLTQWQIEDTFHTLKNTDTPYASKYGVTILTQKNTDASYALKNRVIFQTLKTADAFIHRLQHTENGRYIYHTEK